MIIMETNLLVLPTHQLTKPVTYLISTQGREVISTRKTSHKHNNKVRKRHPLSGRQRSGAVCESRGGRPGPNSTYGMCGRKATLNRLQAQELCKSRGGRL